MRFSKLISFNRLGAIFFPLITLLLYACSHANVTIEEIKEAGSALPVINLGDLPSEPEEIKLSQLAGDLEIISLETNHDYLIGSGPSIYFTQDFIFIGTSKGGMSAGRLLRYDLKGKFLNEIGKEGKGPGEHTSWTPFIIRYFEKDSTVMVMWSGQGENPQRFDLNGKFLGTIKLPLRGMDRIERWSDSLWFTVGKDDWGKSRFPVDSLRTIFFSSDGTIKDKQIRKNYPVLTDKNWEYSFSFRHSMYEYNDSWKFKLRGNDTLFKVVDRKPVADAIFQDRSGGIPLAFAFLTETSSYWLFRMTKTTDLTVDTSNPKSTSIHSNWKDSLVVVNKKTNKPRQIKLVDDVFYMLNGFKYYGSDFLLTWLRWQDNNRVFFILPADEVLSLFKKMDRSKVSAEVLEKLKVLDGLKEDDNPVIFSFTLNDSISF